MENINLTKKNLEEINKENSQINIEPDFDSNGNIIGFSLCMKITEPLFVSKYARADKLPITHP